MIQQPELGKKIADERKSRGLTQEELVEKCNINVRTLQRIESGEAKPRSYTLRLIVEALELDYNKTFGSLKKRDRGILKIWLKQFYIEFLDLFNLKTNTMKKISILSLITILITVGIIAVGTNLRAQDAEEQGSPARVESRNLDSDLPFFDFSCYGCTEMKGLVIGRDMSFKLNGVQVKNVRLMVIDKESLEFDALFVQGTLLERKVIVDYPKKWIIDGSLEYSADMIDKTESQILLRGNARVFERHDNKESNVVESISTDIIIIKLI